MLILAISILIGTGFVCGGAFAGLLVSLFLRPIMSADKTSLDYLKSLKAIITYFVFGGGIAGAGIFAMLGQTKPEEVWACFLIGLLIGFVSGLLYLRGSDGDIRRIYRNSPPSSQDTIRDGLDHIHDSNDEQFAEEYEAAIDSLLKQLPNENGNEQ
ncbi:MAG: hypothetical protein IH984_06995 [Planctomycetes bacterium]|nr:hypothetical protein [Planctomycetota bacterium]